MPHFDTASTPLAGATLVITRPVGMSATFAARARALGGATIVVPGLSLRAAADATTARAALHAASAARIWIFTSPAAVRFAFPLAPDLAIAARARVLCVGPGTARALARRGVRALTPRTSSDSEGLLALPELAEVRGQRVALVCAPNGRDMISQQLRQRGAQVDAIHVYQRAAPRLTRHHFNALANASAPLQTLVVSSARLAALARESGFVNIVEAASAIPDDLLEAAAKALARHRL